MAHHTDLSSLNHSDVKLSSDVKLFRRSAPASPPHCPPSGVPLLRAARRRRRPPPPAARKATEEEEDEDMEQAPEVVRNDVAHTDRSRLFTTQM